MAHVYILVEWNHRCANF